MEKLRDVTGWLPKKMEQYSDNNHNKWHIKFKWFLFIYFYTDRSCFIDVTPILMWFVGFSDAHCLTETEIKPRVDKTQTV